MNDPQEYATSLLSSSWPLGWWRASRDVQETQSWKDSASPIVPQCPYFNPLILPSNLQPKPTYFINLFIGECWSDLYPVGLVLTLWDFCPSGGSGQNVVTVLPSPKGGFWHQWSFTPWTHHYSIATEDPVWHGRGNGPMAKCHSWSSQVLFWGQVSAPSEDNNSVFQQHWML